MSSGTTTSSMRVQRNMGPSYQALSPVPCRPVPCGANSNPSGQSGSIQPMSVELHTGMGFMVHSDPAVLGGKLEWCLLKAFFCDTPRTILTNLAESIAVSSSMVSSYTPAHLSFLTSSPLCIDSIFPV